MNTSASLAQLQNLPPRERESSPDLIELQYRGRGKRGLMVLSLFAFVMAFGAQQWLLAYQHAGQSTQNPTTQPLAAEIKTPHTEQNTEKPAQTAVSTNTTPAVIQGQVASVDATAEQIEGGVENDPLPEQTSIPTEWVTTPAAAQQPNRDAGDALSLRQMQLTRLQHQAAVAMKRDRLMTPAHDNAVHYYRQMLALDPHNVIATEGLQAVALRYSEFARRLTQRGDDAGAARMLAKAEQVWPQQTLSEKNVQPISPAAAPEPLALATVTQSSASRQQQLLVRARNLAQRGDSRAVIELLEPALSEASSGGMQNEALVSVLHGAYLVEGQVSAAQALRTGADLSAGTQTLLHAQELLSAKHYDQAIALLEQSPPEPAENQEYFTLLAGLYYQTGRHQDAQTLYRKLLTLDNTNGRWWLGYAVSSDALKAPETQAAFKGAVQFMAADDPARSYAQHRLQQLSATGGNSQ